MASDAFNTASYFSFSMHHPSTFYKYVSPATALLVLRNSKLRWSSPLLFNDVTEFQRMPRFEPTIAAAYGLLPQTFAAAVFDGVLLDQERLSPLMKALLHRAQGLVARGCKREDLIRALTREAPDADSKVESVLREHFEARDLSKARVLCVTTEHDNDAMWANYAGNHSGCVLGFKHIETLSTPLLEAKRVEYSAEKPIVGSGLDFLLYGDTHELRDRTLKAVCYTKKSSWSYEREWRAITWRRNEHDKQHGDYSFYPEELESVTLGAHILPSTEVEMRGLLSSMYSGTTLYRMAVKNGELVRSEVKFSE